MTTPIKFQYPNVWPEMFEQVSELVKDPVAFDRIEALTTVLARRDQELEDYLSNLSFESTNSRFATIVLAASNTSAAGQAGADYVCPATGAETVFQEALDAVAANSENGLLLLLEGTYIFTSATTTVDIPNYVSVRGMGPDATRIDGSFSLSGVSNGQTSFIRDLRLNGSSAYINFNGVAFVWVDSVYAGYIGGSITDATSRFWVTNCYLEGAPASGYSIDIDGASDNASTFRESLIHGNFAANGIRLTSSSSDTANPGYGVKVSNNNFEDTCQFTFLDDMTVVGNNFQNSATFTDCSRSCVGSNIVLGDLSLTNCDFLTVTGNTIDGGRILLSSTNDSTICSNTLRAGAEHASGAIDLASDSDRNNISMNTARAVSSSIDYNYTINIASGCDNNQAIYNDGYGCWDTAISADAGTGNVLVGNR